MGFGDWLDSICLLRIWLLELVPAEVSTCKESLSFREESIPATLRKGTWMKIDMKVLQDDPLSHFSNVFLVSFVFNLIKCQSPKWRRFRSRVKQCSGWVSIMCPISGLANAEARSIAGQLLFAGTSYSSVRFQPARKGSNPGLISAQYKNWSCWVWRFWLWDVCGTLMKLGQFFFHGLYFDTIDWLFSMRDLCLVQFTKLILRCRCDWHLCWGRGASKIKIRWIETYGLFQSGTFPCLWRCVMSFLCTTRSHFFPCCWASGWTAGALLQFEQRTICQGAVRWPSLRAGSNELPAQVEAEKWKALAEGVRSAVEACPACTVGTRWWVGKQQEAAVFTSSELLQEGNWLFLNDSLLFAIWWVHTRENIWKHMKRLRTCSLLAHNCGDKWGNLLFHHMAVGLIRWSSLLCQEALLSALKTLPFGANVQKEAGAQQI